MKYPDTTNVVKVLRWLKSVVLQYIFLRLVFCIGGYNFAYRARKHANAKCTYFRTKTAEYLLEVITLLSMSVLLLKCYSKLENIVCLDEKKAEEKLIGLLGS